MRSSQSVSEGGGKTLSVGDAFGLQAVRATVMMAMNNQDRGVDGLRLTAFLPFERLARRLMDVHFFYRHIVENGGV